MSTSPDSTPQPTPPRGEPDTAAPTPEAVIRIPATAYVAAASIGVILLLPAVAWPAYWGWLPLAAVAIALWIHRRRTVVSPAGLSVRGLVGTRTVPWDAVRGIVVPTPRIFGKSWARAVLTDDTRLALPAVTWRQLPAVDFASGGRFTAPTPAPPAEDDAAEAE